MSFAEMRQTELYDGEMISILYVANIFLLIMRHVASHS